MEMLPLTVSREISGPPSPIWPVSEWRRTLPSFTCWSMLTLPLTESASMRALAPLGRVTLARPLTLFDSNHPPYVFPVPLVVIPMMPVAFASPESLEARTMYVALVPVSVIIQVFRALPFKLVRRLPLPRKNPDLAVPVIFR